MDRPDLASLHSALSTCVVALTLPRLLALRLFTLPGDPVTQAVTRLTGITQAEAERLNRALMQPADLADALNNDMTGVYYLALIGHLVSGSPLGASLRTQVLDKGQDLQVLEAMAEQVVDMLFDYLPDPEAAAATTEALRTLFAAEQYSLPALWVPDAPATPDADPDDIWMTMRPTARELNLFALALNLTAAARFGVPHPLGQALNTTPGLGSDTQLIDLAQRFKLAPPEEPLEVTGPDMVRLYLALHALMLLIIAELQPALLSRLDPTGQAEPPWLDPEQQQHFVEWVGVHVEALSQIFDEHFADEPAYQAAQAEVRRLAGLV